MPEICKDAALYFNPYDIKDIAFKLELVMKDKNLRQILKENALRRSMEFSWDKSAKETIEVLKKAYK